jgi:poly-beta-1,6-N-acetyl-D-glucosamine synthase
MLSVIIVSYKEARTIGKAIKCIAEQEYSGIPQNYEIIQISPDEETLNAGMEMAKSLNILQKFIQIVDPCEGKPHALNLAFKKAKGDILILTDGDVYFDKNAVKELIAPFKDKTVGGVSGRPISIDKKDTMMGYYGNLLSDAAHHKRTSIVKKGQFFPMSGYIMAIRNFNLKLPKDVLSDDAYISYEIANKAHLISYAPKAKACISYPKHLNDYYKQKTRSLGGYIQLEQFGVVKKGKKTRTLKDEIAYFWFPFKYAKTFREFFWSKMLFPVRIITWMKIFFERRILKKDFKKTWIRIESTK